MLKSRYSFFILLLVLTQCSQSRLHRQSQTASSGENGSTASSTEEVLPNPWFKSEASDSVPSAAKIIFCENTRFCVSGTAPNIHEFTAEECGGVLPDENYIGSLSAMETSGGDESWQIIQPTDSVGPFVTWWSIDGSGCDSRIAAVFHRYK